MIWLPVVFVSALIAFALSSITGGGASVILIPLLSLLLPIAEVPGALVLGTLSSSLSRGYLFFDKINWKLVSIFVPTALPAVAIGAWLLSYVDPLVISWICGLFLLSNISLLFVQRMPETNSPPSLSRLKIMGVAFLVGLISGVTGAVGVLFNGFYLKSGLPKDEIMATRAANEVLLHIVKLIFYAQLGLFSLHSVTIGTLIGVAAICSAYGVRFLLPLVNDRIFRQIGYGAMVVSGVLLIATTTRSILEERDPSVRIVAVDGGIEAKVHWAFSSLALEVEDDGEVSIERVVALHDLPNSVRSQVVELTKNSKWIEIEEVYGWRNHYYEIHFDQDGGEKKFEVWV